MDNVVGWSPTSLELFNYNILDMYVMQLKGWKYVKDSSWRVYIFDDEKLCENHCDICYWLNYCVPKKIDNEELKLLWVCVKIISRIYSF